jgi:four helix bundle protein
VEREKVRSFEDLLVWQKGIALTKLIYEVSGQGVLQKDFGLKDQLQRAAVSIPSNIAEGFERASTRDYIHFLVIAKGSAGELRSLLQVALEQYSTLRAAAVEISSYLANLIKSLRNR